MYDLMEITVEIVAAYISYNAVPASEAPNLIASVHAAIGVAAGRELAKEAVVDPPAPAVSVSKSITPDYLTCLDDGKRFKSLRRHLAQLGMTPEQYRAKWRLPPDYPMVAANYAAKRSEMAKRYGFGLKHDRPIAAPAPATAPRKRGRPRKARA